METKFYLFRQNNSGGYFLRDRKLGVDANMLIEANSEVDAEDIFAKIEDEYGEYSFNESCDCCGDRWYSHEPDEVFDDIPTWALEDRSTSIIMLSGKVITIREEEDSMNYQDSVD